MRFIGVVLAVSIGAVFFAAFFAKDPLYFYVSLATAITSAFFYFFTKRS
jgi:hypothetical protein